MSSALAGEFFTTEPPGKPKYTCFNRKPRQTDSGVYPVLSHSVMFDSLQPQSPSGSSVHGILQTGILE